MNKQAKTKLIIILGILLVSIFVFSFVLAGTTNIKEYDSDTQTVTIKNIALNDIATIKLNTPINNHVPIGYQKVAEFTLQNYQDSSTIFKEMEFFDKKAGDTKINRTFDFLIQDIIEVKIDDYENDCKNQTNENGTFLDCKSVNVGSHLENQIKWVTFDKLKNKETIASGIYTIGIFTDVQVGDYVEWIPTFYDIKINEWATWTADLNTDLVAYYAFEEGSGTAAADSSPNGYDLVGVNTPSWSASGKIGNSINLNGTLSQYFQNVDDSGKFSLNGSISVNVWVTSSTSNSGYKAAVSKTSYTGNGDSRYSIRGYTSADTGLIQTRYTDGAAQLTHTGIVLNEWYMMTLVINSTGLSGYRNGTIFGYTPKGATALQTIVENDPFLIGGFHELGSVSYFWNGKIDEVGVWNRALSQAEVTQLYNGGVGITYGINNPPSMILNAPADDATNQAPLTLLNVTLTDPDGDTMNVTFYNNSDDSIICFNTSISNNTAVKCTWGGLSELTDYQWYVNVTDGSLTTKSSIWNFSTGDFTSPIITPPSNATLEYLVDSLGVVFTADETINTWVVNDTTNFQINSTGYLSNKTALAVGTYVLNISANDSSGNRGDITYEVIVQDTIAPSINIHSPIINSSNYSTSTIFFNATSTENIIEWRIDYNGTNTTGFTINTSLEVADGSYILIIWGGDSSGNWGYNDSYHFNVDANAPLISIIDPSSEDYNIIVTTLNFSVSDINIDTCWYSFNSILNITMNCSANLTGLLSVDGMNNWTIYANDTNGKINQTSVNFTIDSIAPQITTSISEGVKLTRTTGDVTQFNFTYSIVELHWAYANYSFVYPNGTSVIKNSSSNQSQIISLDIDTNGGYQWVVWSNDTFSNYQRKLINFRIEFEENSGKAHAVITSEEVEEGIFVPPQELSFLEKNKFILIALIILGLVMYGGKKNVTILNPQRRK